MSTIRIVTVISLLCALVFAASVSAAPAPDRHPGDTAIYTQRAADVAANVLFIIDNSGSAANVAAGTAYDMARDYNPTPRLFVPKAVYEADNQGDFSKMVIADVDSYNFV